MKRPFIVGMLLAAFVFAFVPAISASAAPTAGGTANTGTSCVITLAPLQPGQVTSRVISRKCFTGTTADAKRALAPALAPAADKYKIMEIWEDQYYKGNFMYFNGPEPCSSSNGFYGLEDTNPENYGSVNWQGQSWEAGSFCWHTQIFYNTGYGLPSYTYKQGVYEAGVVGSGFNKHFWSMVTGYENIG